MKWLWWRIKLAFEWLRERTPWRHRDNLSKARPHGWKDSGIGSYLEHMWSNSIATFANINEARRVKDVDDLFAEFVTNASLVKNKGAVSVSVPLLLTIRTHAAFRSGASLALSGAVPEAMASLRLCLETAGYAAMMQGNDSLSLIWLNRGDNHASKDAARNAFKHSDVRKALEARNKALAGVYQKLYEYLIDGGAHPNERRFIRSLEVERLDDGGARLTQVYLQADPKALEEGLLTAGKVGVCALTILEMMYADEFQQLNISARLPIVRKGI